MNNATDEYLVFFETSGNQAYIYATNKLRENIGASELTYRAGTHWILEAAGFTDALTFDPAEFRGWLKSGPSTGDGVEVILATSGKALLVTKSHERAREIITRVTARASIEAPGLSITGAIVELSGRDRDSVSKAIHEAHSRFNGNRDLMPVPQQRFAMLPYCEPCATSGLPAQTVEGDGTAYAAPSLGKRARAADWFNRIRKVFKSADSDLFIAAGADQLEKEFDELDWLGVVYSDGNGLGQIMMKFKEWLEDGDDYLATYRNFSVELDAATEGAFYRACTSLAELGAVKDMKRSGHRLPLVPLLLGGDDLTVLVDGRYALPFSRAFLEAFEEETANQPTLARIAGKALGARRLSAGAGVALVKKHFPFHSAHALAESLLGSAKLSKRKVQGPDQTNPYPCSSLDFHVLFDAAYSGLEEIREKRRKGPDGERLWGGPYVTTPLEQLGGAASLEWASRHHIVGLLQQVSALNARGDDDRLKLPNSQMHMLREALAQGKTVADARLKELHWLDSEGLKRLREGESLFFQDDDCIATRFLDALTTTGFWRDERSYASEEAKL